MAVVAHSLARERVQRPMDPVLGRRP